MADSEAELDKIAAHAPGARVYLRLIVENSMADWPLSRKFGCAGSALPALLNHAVAVGLVPFGLSFHVGSQMTKLEAWDVALADAKRVFDTCSISTGCIPILCANSTCFLCSTSRSLQNSATQTTLSSPPASTT
mgnify:CR=1 FL=1